MDDFNAPDDLVLSETIKRDFRSLDIIFREATSHMEKSKGKAVFFLIIISAAIIFFPLFYETCVFTDTSIKRLQREYSFSDSYLFTIYLMGKAIGFLFLFSLFGWVAKIYNHLRRLEITYYDKFITARALFILYADSDFLQADQYFTSLFEPTLQQAEKQKQHDHEHHKHLADSVADLIDKIVESLKRK